MSFEASDTDEFWRSTSVHYHPMPGEGATVALVRGRTPAEALDILGPDREVGPAPAGLLREWAADQRFQRVIATALEAGE